jgi:hypothetical protein
MRNFIFCYAILIILTILTTGALTPSELFNSFIIVCAAKYLAIVIVKAFSKKWYKVNL